MKLNTSYIIRRLLKYSSPLLRPADGFLMRRYAARAVTPPAVFLIGAPRSGSTAVFQLLSHHLDVGYLSNLMNMGKEIPVFAAFLHRNILGNEGHGSFNSSFGITENDGFAAPNEGHFWKVWFRGVHHIRPEDMPERHRNALRAAFLAHSGVFGRPFLLKNLSFSVRLELLHEVLPEAKIIHLKRSPFFNIQSMVLAKRNHQIPANQLWSTHPPAYERLLNLPEAEQITKQYFSIEKEIERNKHLFLPDRFISLNYEDFFSDAGKLVDDVRSFMHPDVAFRNQEPVRNLPDRNTLKLGREEARQLQQIIENERDYEQ